MKVIRGDENDIDGISRIHRASRLDYKELVRLYCTEMDHVAGDPRKIHFNFLNVIDRIFGPDALKHAEEAVTKKYGKIS